MDRRVSIFKQNKHAGKLNIVMTFLVIVYRHMVLGMDVSLFLLKTIGEYIRLAYRTYTPRPLREVAGDVALVTGAGHGMGRQLALRLASLGCLVVCIDRDGDTNKTTVSDIQEAGGIAWAFQCDVSKSEEVAKMARQVREEVGDVNILVNNAGIMVIKQLLQHSDSEVQDTMDVNLLGQIWVLREFLPAMIKMDRGSIIFMCGLPGHAGAPYMIPYSASKFAVRGLMEALYVELRQTHPGNKLHLMLVSPFIVETGMVKRHRIRFSMLGTVDTASAVETIILSLRRRAAIVFIPEVFYWLNNFIRVLPAKVQLLITDFIDTGINLDA